MQRFKVTDELLTLNRTSISPYPCSGPENITHKKKKKNGKKEFTVQRTIGSDRNHCRLGVVDMTLTSRL